MTTDRELLRRPELRAAFEALAKLTDEDRGLVLSFFCPGCHRYVGPDDQCHCMNDE